MGKHRIVIALGGNALGRNTVEQTQIVKETVRPLIDLVADGNHIILTHGNGPQVGMINLAFEKSGENMPFPECGAMSQGYIGYHLQNALYTEIKRRKLPNSVVSVVTQVVVAKDDPAFNDPTKPIGSFYDEGTAVRLAEEKNWVMKEDAGRGWRRHVPSPLPVEIVEAEAIKHLLDAGQIVIAAGGGGIPVVAQADELNGVAAVIDKDFAAAKLAELIEADLLIILTAVENVSLNYNTAKQEDLKNVTAKEMREYIKAGHFASGSMLPKVEASLLFVESGPQRQAIITSLAHAKDAIKGQGGTRIYC